MFDALKKRLRDALLGSHAIRQIAAIEPLRQSVEEWRQQFQGHLGELRARLEDVEGLRARLEGVEAALPPSGPDVPPMRRHAWGEVEALAAGVGTVYGTDVAGDIAEFGTMTGVTAVGLARAMAACDTHLGYALRHAGLPDKALHLFDSFCGLPHATHPVDAGSPHVRSGVWGPGTCTGLTPSELLTQVTRHIPAERVRIFEGWFKDTLPTLPPGTQYSLIHIDSDLYSSALDALDYLFGHGCVAEGALVFFDNWNCNKGSFEFGERRAWREVTEKYAVVASDEGGYGIMARRFQVHAYIPGVLLKGVGPPRVGPHTP